MRQTLLSALLLILPAGGIVTSPAIAMQEGVPTELDEQVADFIHYVKIARYDVAKDFGYLIIDADVSPEAFVDAIESGRFQDQTDRFRDAVGLALQVDDFPELAEVAASLEELFEDGKLQRARNPDEVTRNIEMLTANMRGRDIGTQRLVQAGEYAVPQLFDALLDSADAVRQERVRQVLIAMQAQAVMPLSVALENVRPEEQLIVLDVLGRIRYDQSVPFIQSVRASTDSPEVRTAADAALSRLGARAADELGGAWSFASLAERYYDEQTGVTSFPGEEYQLLWSYLPEAPARSLIATPIRSEVYHEAMAMRLTERALEGAPQSVDALALWVAANLRREIETPEGYDNPAYAADRREAMYFAVASGMSVSQRVLARALDDRNTMLARRAIDAMSRTAGGSSLWSSAEGRQPLLEALSYPNRRVQYDAALTLGAAQPKQTFAGAERVVPLLAGAVRDATSRYALVLADDAEVYQGYRTMLENDGFTVLPRSSSIGEAYDSVVSVPAVDLVVTAVSKDRAMAALPEVHGSSRLAAAPVLMMLPRREAAELSPRFERDRTVFVRAMDLSPQQFAAATEQLLEDAVGGVIDPEEAADYADRSIRVLRDLAVSRNEALPIAEATGPLIAAMGEVDGELEQRIAEVLAWVDRADAQQAIVDAAMTASGEQRIAMLGVAAGSAQRFGNKLEERQVQRVIDLALNATGEEGTAAAALMGSLNLANDQVLPLVLGD